MKAGDALEVSIGIDTGPVVLGVLGSEERLIRSVVGKPVERAQRLAAEAASNPAKLLISRATRDQLGKESRFTLRGASQATTKQGETSIDPFEIDRG